MGSTGRARVGLQLGHVATTGGKSMERARAPAAAAPQADKMCERRSQFAATRPNRLAESGRVDFLLAFLQKENSTALWEKRSAFRKILTLNCPRPPYT